MAISSIFNGNDKKAQRISTTQNAIQSTLKYIRIKSLKTSDKKKVRKAIRCRKKKPS